MITVEWRPDLIFGVLGLLAAAVAMFLWTFPRRAHFLSRLALVLLVSVALPLIDTLVFGDASVARTPRGSLLEQFWTFSAVVVFVVWAISFCFDLSIWAALFCATASYTIENLASSINDYVLLFLQDVWAINLSREEGLALLVAIVVVIYATSYLLFVRRIGRNGLLQIDDRRMMLMLVLVILINIVFDLSNKWLALYDVPALFISISRISHMVTCVFILWVEYEMLYNKRLQADAATMARMRADEEKQHELSRATIDAINVKCHDIRHQIRHFDDANASTSIDKGVLDAIAHEVNVYDSNVKTGNDVLDVIVTEKSLICEREGITLSCIIDGAALDFVEPADLYSLFGNALENAIEAARGIPDTQHRSISLVVRQRMGVVSVHVENFFKGDLVFLEGMPQTSKADKANHGFGTRSMRQTVERYGGTLTLDAGKDGDGFGTFRLDAMIPIPA